MKKQALTALFLVVLTVGMASTAMAESFDNQETSSVNVNVASETALDVKPDTLTYDSVSVGDRVNQTNNDHGYESIKVENTGSQAIQRVWMETTHPSTNPFGQGSTSAHDSANFLQVKPTDGSRTEIRGNGSTYHYVQRVEFFQDSSPLVEVGDFGTTYENVDVGRIRTGNNEFYFALGYDGTSCDTGQIRIGDTPNTPSSIGTNDFSDDNNASYSAYSLGATGNSYGIVNETVSLAMDGTVPDLDYSNEVQSYDILTKCDGLGSVTGIDEPHLILTRYNIEAGGATNLDSDQASGDGNIATEIFRSVGTSNHLEPGSSFAVDVAVQVPRGVPTGDITQGTLTVYSQAAP